MKKNILIIVSIVIGGLLLGGVTEAADVVEITVGGIPTLTICDENVSNYCISMMDRNMQAENNDITSTGSYGFLYRWGANGGGYSPFNAPSTWSQVGLNNDLWGDITKTLEARQGPCPEGYHVPTKYELNGLMDIWAGTTTSGSITNNISQFLSDFKIPFVGYREGEYGNIQDFENSANIWSSTCNGEPARSLIINQNEAILSGNTSRHDALSVRCFKNEPVKFTATFVANGADSIGATTLTGSSVIMPNIVRTGWEILGRSTDSGATEAEYQTGETVVLSGNTTFYAITKKTYTATFQKNGATSIGTTGASCSIYNTQTSCGLGVGDITICNPEDPSECITMKDRNLGASSAGLGKCAYGDYFQWGNNYGFPGEGILTTGFEKVDCTPYGIGNNYSSNIFFVGTGDWCQVANDDLWGGATDGGSNGYGYPVTNPTNKKGPCPEGYHVPGAGEWGKVILWRGQKYISAGNDIYLNTSVPYLPEIWNNGEARYQFQKDFQIPMASQRSSTSIVTGDYVYNAWFQITTYDTPKEPNHYVKVVYLNSSDIGFASSSRKNAYSMRCFKDFSLDFSGTVYGKSSVSATTISRDGWNILGWGKSPDDTTAEYDVCDEIELTGNTTLYAITQKNLTATFELNGVDSIGTGILSCTGYNESGCTVVAPSIVKDGYVVLGWSANSGALIGDYDVGDIITLTGDTVLYAITRSYYTATFELNGADSIGSDILTGSSIVLPNIVRTGWEIVGWSIYSSSTTGEYAIGDTVELEGNTTFYAITKKTYTVTFDANGADSIGASTGLCDVYNNDATCMELGIALETGVYKTGVVHTTGGDNMGLYMICNPSDTGECLAMMDKNLGASSVGTGSSSYGYFYQWGNNHGFVSTYYRPSNTSTTVDTSANGPGNYYDGSSLIFMKGNPYDWSSNRNDNLRGGISDDDSNDYGYPVTNPIDRQGPCPVGYHIPSIGERKNLFERWVTWYKSEGNYLYLNYSNGFPYFSKDEDYFYRAQTRFQNDFSIPFVGRYTYTMCISSWQVCNDRNGVAAYLWSSTPSERKTRHFTVSNINNVPTISALDTTDRQNATSLRCFKNLSDITPFLSPSISRSGWEILGWSTNPDATTGEYIPGESLLLSGNVALYAITQKSVTLNFDSMGGTEIDVQTGLLYSTMTMTGIEPSDPNRSNSIFSGWYLSGSDVEFDFENTEITGNITLYAHWDCEEGYTENLSGDACVKSFTVILNPNGGGVNTGSVMIGSGDIFDLSGYTASSGGYVFVGWGETIDATEILTINPTITGDIVLYAVYKVDSNNNGIADEDEMFTVTFDTAGGVEIASQGVLSGESITQVIPVKTGFLFSGWYYSGVSSDYYVIDSTDTNYPQGCNTAGLNEPDKYCLLKIYSSHTYYSGTNGFVYVAPRVTEAVKDGYTAPGYCTGLDTAGLSWELPLSHAGMWQIIASNSSKIYGLQAQGSQKSNHYWAWASWSMTSTTNQNCRLDGKCGDEASSYKLSVRCISKDVDVPLGGLGGSQYSGEGITSDITLVAKWNGCMTGYTQSGDDCIRDIVIISFEPIGGTNIVSQEFYPGSTGIKPSDPTRPNSIFSGWYLSGSDVEFDFENTEITGNTILYAHWDCEEGYIENLSGDACVALFTVTLNPNGGSVDTGSVMIGSGDIFDLSGYMASSGGYAFVGWGERADAVEPLAVNPTITGDITLYALYKIDMNNNGIADEDESYSITFDSQGGSAVASQENISLYATGVRPSDPSKERSLFSGWYLSGSETEFDFENTQITGNIVLYAHWDCDSSLGYELVGDRCVSSLDSNTIMSENPNFEYGAITIPRPDSLSGTYKNSPSEYIIMDRNLGATEAGTGVSAYGYYYQYGNNYGFVGEPTVTGFRATANIDLTPYGPSNPYYSGTFITEEYGGDDNWAVTGNSSIWGKESIKESLRQGPCPVGWHIPTKTEWSEVVDYWIAGSGGGTMNVSAFRDDLKIPLPGVIARSTAKFEDNSVGSIGRYRVTSLNGTKGYAFEIKKTSYNKNHTNNLVNGYSLRCFKDDDTVYVVTYSDGVMGEELFADYTYTGLKGDFIPAFPGGDPSGGTGRIFNGWYMDVNGVSTLVANPSLVQITGDISLYAKWLEYVDEGQVNDLDIYFALDSGHQDHYTIMNRNMGADVPGTGSASYGYHYQWGNIYGFSSTGSVVASSTKEDASGYGPGNYFSGSTFITGSKNWSSKRNDDLWGDTSDTSLARQGPCPVGYHVPSAAEWLMIHNSWSGVNVGNPEGCMKLTGCAVKIQNDLLLPNVGRRAEDGVLGFQSAASYWTSTPSDNEKAYGFYYNKGEKTESLALQPNNQDPYARGRSVRCVKNMYNEPLSLQLNGGRKAAVSVWSGKLHYLTNPTKSGYEFAGWYKDAAKTAKIENGAFVSSNVTTLYAKWSGDEVSYTARHYLKKAGLTGYDLYDTEVFSGDTMILLSDIAKDDLNPCAEYSSGSLSGDENGPGEIVTSAIGSPGVTTMINLYYIRKKFTVDLTSDLFTNILAGTGEFECGQEVEIRAYPIEGYHFNVWSGSVD